MLKSHLVNKNFCLHEIISISEKLNINSFELALFKWFYGAAICLNCYKLNFITIVKVILQRIKKQWKKLNKIVYESFS